MINQAFLDPPKSTAAGLPIQTLTYGVTLQNASDLPTVRANAEHLLLTSPLLRTYLVLPEQTANLTSTTANPAVILLLPPMTTTTAATATATTGLQLQPIITAPTQQLNLHSFDGYVTSPNDLALISGDLQTLWAQAYGVPPQTLNFTVLNTATLPGSSDRPVTRIQYGVAAPNQTETPQVYQAFQNLLPQSSLGTIMVPAPAAPTARTGHALRIAVSNATDMDLLTNGVRNSWVAALSKRLALQFYFSPHSISR